MRSTLHYLPSSELEFGSLTCLASNSLGPGMPCAFSILPIGPPEPPARCRATNVSYSAFLVGFL